MSSPKETCHHINRVRQLISDMIANLVNRGVAHDESKLEEPECSAFERIGKQLSEMEYGTPEYRASLRELGPALKHHYEHNSHHPEHWPDGVKNMSLLDIMEMFCDWKAAGERHKNGSLEQSIIVNTDRFDLDPQLAQIFENTRIEMGW